MDSDTKAEIKSQEINTKCDTAIDLELDKLTVDFIDYFLLQIFAKTFTPNILSGIITNSLNESKNKKQFLNNVLSYVNKWVAEEATKDSLENTALIKNITDPVLNEFNAAVKDLKLVIKHNNLSVEDRGRLENSLVRTFRTWVNQIVAAIK